MNTTTTIDTATAAQIAQILEDNPGKENAPSRGELRVLLRERSGKYVSLEELDEIVEWLVVGRHLPIAESDRGYYYISSRAELDEYVDSLNQEIMELNQLRESVERAVRVNPSGFEDEDQVTLHTFEDEQAAGD